MAHLEAEWPSKQNILIFCFSYFTIFKFHLLTQFWQNRSQKVFSWGLQVCPRGPDILKIYI